jgi:hypothetical protein
LISPFSAFNLRVFHCSEADLLSIIPCITR